MNKYKIIRFIALAVFVVAFCFWGYTELVYKDAEVSYKDLQKRVVTVVQPNPESDTAKTDSSSTAEADTAPLLEIDHEQLLNENHDYICWLSACGDRISYPVVQGRTNDEYLHHTFFGDKSFVGSIFIDYRCSADLSDFQTIFYGHSMKDRTMFRLIADYTAQSMANEYPFFYVYTPDGRQQYKIFAVTDVQDNELITALNDPSPEERQAFIDRLKATSLYALPDTPAVDDKIISLVTCDVRDDSKRVVVNAYKLPLDHANN